MSINLIAELVTTESHARQVMYRLTRPAQVVQGPFFFDYEELEFGPKDWAKIAAKLPHLKGITVDYCLRTIRSKDKAVHLKVFKAVDGGQDA